MMRYVTLVILSIFFIGCTGEKIEMSGNKPPAFFKVANDETMKDYLFDTEDFSFEFPTAKQTDFSKMGGWSGMSMRDGKTIAFGFDKSIVYNISVSTPLRSYEYTERESAIEAKDTSYIRKRKKWLKLNDKLYIENHGKENYICTNTIFTRGRKSQSVYNCYKFNSNRTKAKNVVVSLTYNKPNDPKLAKQYTYKDLQKRAKRTLDSLYIKDGWSD